MTALVLEDNVKLSGLLKSQIKSAPVKADYWNLRCEKEELFILRGSLEESLNINEKLQPAYKAMVLSEINNICAKYT